uniref:Uncharacterized protein n=1 Tax=Romanomermis culicivorax TaxID=13658 RepID=A0A915L101_ROMCU
MTTSFSTTSYQDIRYGHIDKKDEFKCISIGLFYLLISGIFLTYNFFHISFYASASSQNGNLALDHQNKVDLFQLSIYLFSIVLSSISILTSILYLEKVTKPKFYKCQLAHLCVQFFWLIFTALIFRFIIFFPMFSRRLFQNVIRISNFSRFSASATILPSTTLPPPVAAVAAAGRRRRRSSGRRNHAQIDRYSTKKRTYNDLETYAQKSVVPILLRYNFSEQEILDLLTFWNDENLNGDFWYHLEARKLNAIFESFGLNGVGAKSVALLLMKDKQVLELDPDQLQMKVLNLRHIFAPKTEKSQRYNQIFSRFLVENSQILFLNDEENYRLSKHELRNFFSAKQIDKILSRTPEILLKKNFDDLELLYEYFYFVMGVEPKVLTKIRWFDKNFAFIRLRHQFALKTGAFIRYNEKKPALSAKSIGLDKIIDSKDLNFAQSCNCSLDEYEFFRQISEEKFSNLEDFKLEIAKHCQHKRHFQEKYGRKIEEKTEKEDQEEEEDEEFDEETELSLKIPGFNNDRPVKFFSEESI